MAGLLDYTSIHVNQISWVSLIDKEGAYRGTTPKVSQDTIFIIFTETIL
jgi:hypothetical protein